jgi:hypothetical protein
MPNGRHAFYLQARAGDTRLDIERQVSSASGGTCMSHPLEQKSLKQGLLHMDDPPVEGAC